MRVKGGGRRRKQPSRGRGKDGGCKRGRERIREVRWERGG